MVSLGLESKAGRPLFNLEKNHLTGPETLDWKDNFTQDLDQNL